MFFKQSLSIVIADYWQNETWTSSREKDEDERYECEEVFPNVSTDQRLKSTGDNNILIEETV